MADFSSRMVGGSVPYANPAVPRKTPERTVQRVARHVQVVGRKAVYGIEPGSTGHIDLTEGQLRSLIASGHLAEVSDVDNHESVPESPAENIKEGD